jgi:hypothetical protein
MLKFAKLLTLALLPALAVTTVWSSHVSAASLNYTDHPMDDSLFRASFTMTAQDIQNFLVSKNSGLANFTDVEDCGSPSGGHYSFYATYYHCGTRQVAAQIIYDAAQAYGINPQAILATMQKEQSLITTPNPIASQINYAMGYGCPDSGGCSFAGFFNQVDNGTWQFRTDVELSSGRNYWGYTPASYPCNHSTRYYNNPLVPGQDVIFIDDYGTGYARFVIPNASTATLYCYTPHVFPGSGQEYYSGSYWFVYYFAQWFGGSATPFAFKSPDSGTVYIYVSGYKVAVPSIAMLQDYGISPGAIHVLSQDKVNAIPTPSVNNDGVSPVLSNLVKSSSDSDSDGGSVYLVSVGQKSGITSFQQFTDFGFNTNNIGFLPLDFINSLGGTQPLSYYLQTPQSLVFQVTSALKRPIFDFQTFISANPSGKVTPVSALVLNSLPSGTPLSNKPLMIKPVGDSTVYLYTVSGNYYAFSSLNDLVCWGAGALSSLPFVQLPDNSYVAPISSGGTPTCILKDSSNGTTYFLNNTTRYTVPSTYGTFTASSSIADIVTASSAIPNSSNSLKRAIKAGQGATVWYLENGTKRPIPSLSDLVLLGVAGTIDTLDPATVAAIPGGGVKLATGQPVKAPSNSSVYIVSGDTRIPVSSSDDFIAYGFSWQNIDTIDATSLNSLYPAASTTLNKYFYNQANSSSYIVDPNGCYSLTSSQLTSYGQSQSQLAANQAYDKNTVPNLNLNACRAASVFVKSPDSSTVYWVDAGQKHPVSSWNALVNKSGSTNPNIINLSTSMLQTLSTGSVL